LSRRYDTRITRDGGSVAYSRSAPPTRLGRGVGLPRQAMHFELSNGSRVFYLSFNDYQRHLADMRGEIWRLQTEALIKAGILVIQAFMPTVAKKTGKMRQAVEIALREQLVVQKRIVVDIDLIDAAEKVFYTIYHIFRGKFDKGSRAGYIADYFTTGQYKDPTTKDTKPMDLIKLELDFEKAYFVERAKVFTAAGFNLERSVQFEEVESSRLALRSNV